MSAPKSSRPAFTQAKAIPAVDIKTRAQLDQLRKRVKPSPVHELRPKGADAAQVDTHLQYQDQSRLRQLQQSLNQAKGSIHRAAVKTKMRGGHTR
ncbi:MAG: hypothetical protein CMK09_00100 [Ponticaulis sp.]|nr:hypothetical protein [Ponticaulis sp.]|tara:strand:- start:34279 stop:34563 length:285 start_codon:yes stop_codon:yes gene_type:complete